MRVLEHFEACERFRKDVRGHVIGRAIQQLYFSTLNDIADEMVLYIDVLHLRIIIVKVSKVNCRLVVAQ